MANETFWDVDLAGPDTRTVWDRDLAGPGTETHWDLIPDVIGQTVRIVWESTSRRAAWVSSRMAKWR